MQTCFFAISGVLPREEAIAQIKKAIKKTYGKRGEAVVQKNFAAVDAALAHLHEVEVPERFRRTSIFCRRFPRQAPPFVRDVLGAIAAGNGDSLPVSALPAGGTFPTGTAQWEKRNIAQYIPVWDKDLCIQCGKCVMVCPHAVIRAKVLRCGAGSRRRLLRLQVGQAEVEGHGAGSLHAAGGSGRLHRLRAVRGSVPGKEQERRQAQGHQHGRCRLRLREVESENWEFF